MSFAAIRQAALQAGPLNSDLFAEDGKISSPVDGEDPVDVVVKIEHDDRPRPRGRGTGSGNESLMNTLDERERILVTVSRDVTKTGSYPSRPAPGASFYRDPSRDPPGPEGKQRPFVFKSEVIFEGDQHAVYVFERPRRVAQGKGN